jgi:drug/metabolite transporter (DMT)-like permease
MSHPPHDLIARTHLTRGYSLALASAAVLSTTAILIRYLTVTYQIPALLLAFWRDLFVFFTLLPALALIRRPFLRVNRRHLPYLVLYGMVLAVFNSFWTLSVSLNGAAVATLLAYCSAGFTALLGWWLLREGLGWGKLLAVTLCLAGCVLVSGALTSSSPHLSLPGIITGILTGLGYAAYTLMGRSASQRGLDPWTSLLYIFGFASLFLLAFNLLSGGRIPGAVSSLQGFLFLGTHWTGWGVLFLLAAGPTVIGFGLYNLSLTHLPSSVANLVATLEPVFTAVSAWFLLGERLGWIQIAGSLLILGGVIFLRLYEGRQTAMERAPTA